MRETARVHHIFGALKAASVQPSFRRRCYPVRARAASSRMPRQLLSTTITAWRLIPGEVHFRHVIRLRSRQLLLEVLRPYRVC
jgi:hypothetical protein